MVREKLGSITPSCRNRVRRTTPPIADIRIYFTPFSRGDTQIFTVSAKEDDPIEALVRRGAKAMLQAALEQEVDQYLERARHQRSNDESELRGYRKRLLTAA